MKYIATLLLASLAVGSCSDQSTTTHPTQFKLVVESPFESHMLVPVYTRAYDPNSLVLAVKLNGDDAETRKIDSTSYEVSGSFSGDSVEIDISWSEVYREVVMQLATYKRTFPVSDQATFSVKREDYNTSIYDNDRDNDSNLEERVNNTDPYNPNLCSTCRTDIDSQITRVSLSEAPVIDGRWEASWINSQFKDIDGELLIQNLVETGGSELDALSVYGGEPPFRWASMHDGEFLYVMVFGESADVGAQTPFRDSANANEDDSVYIAIETSTAYRGYTVPLVDIDFNENGRNQTEIYFDDGSDALDGVFTDAASIDQNVSAHTCMCTGAQNVWEIRIPLSSVNGTLTIGDPFKLLVQLVDDVDGGAAEFRWQWPSDAASFNGTVALQ